MRAILLADGRVILQWEPIEVDLDADLRGEWKFKNIKNRILLRQAQMVQVCSKQTFHSLSGKVKNQKHYLASYYSVMR